MKAFSLRHVAVAVLLSCSLVGCNSTGKTANKSLTGASLSGIKSDDKALRTAVDKDPFPKAQGAMVAAKPGKTSGQ
jgi:hypothetical protein